ncbi:MAG: hypothetical protein SPJ04_03625 [Bdellovibrionota bacterium]|nr:hypothetical protein [Pseudomonadota bacterium]MDY6090327.1 hypothetical protein [Bdellovibrionota bacterium]
MKIKRFFTIAAVLNLICVSNSLAEHPINVQKNAINKEYYKAMVSFERLPRQKLNKEVLLSAAQSAWALSLPDTAIELFDKILDDKNISNKEKAKIYLYKGIIDFQEGKYSISQIFAKKALSFSNDISESLKSAALKLLGDSYFKLKLYGEAKREYIEALKYADNNQQPSIYLQKGMAEFYLGSFDEAQKDLQKVSMDNEDAPLAIKLLMKILLEKKDYQKLKKWIEVLNIEFPDEFIDSWIDYAKVKVAISEDNKREALKVLEFAKDKYPESDSWINLARASLETYLWNKGVKN